MKYRVTLPIIRFFQVIVDAENEDVASDLAQACYCAWSEDPLSEPGPVEFKDDDYGRTHIGQFVQMGKASWIGDDDLISVVPIDADADASERASVTSEQQDVQTT